MKKLFQNLIVFDVQAGLILLTKDLPIVVWEQETITLGLEYFYLGE